jgi:dTDP-4-dehydrorhamnose reductase
MRVLVVGASGMLGNAMFRVLSENSECEVFGTVRGYGVRQHFSDTAVQRLIVGVEVENHDSLAGVFATVRPQIVVNCVGLVKQLDSVNDPLQAVPINTLLPHRLAILCQATAARLVHFSTDCVFSGMKGGYMESDFPDAHDLYGRTKLLGEVDYPHAITLRTSMIGHELAGSRSLIGWFLGQQGSVRGFTRAIFSGLPTVELSRVVRDVVFPRPKLRGVYHVAANPISKFELLQVVAEIYGRTIEIVPDGQLIINRSLNADRFRDATGYVAPAWPELIKRMYEFK